MECIHLENTRKESWKKIQGYEGRYEISDKGNLLICARQTTHWTGHSKSFYPARLAKPSIRRGYCVVMLTDSNGGKKKHSIHRLVAQAFIPNPNNLLYVNHLDGNKRNNDVLNLVWCTQLENMRHASASGLLPKGERRFMSKLKDADVIEVRRLKKIYPEIQIKYLAKSYGVNASSLNRACNGVTFKHLPL